MIGNKEGTYNGVFCSDEISGDIVTDSSQRVETLKRNAVSNKVSAVINQATGVLVGIILVFIALYINFQDNTHDILVLSMLGYQSREIRKMLINVYFPILWLSFIVSIVPSILLAKTIQNSLSISTNDYMPFGVNLIGVLAAFIMINLIYQMVQAAFSFGVKNKIKKRDITELVSVE